MSLNTGVDSRVEAEWSQSLNDISHVVVEVTTYENRSGGVLTYDVSCDLNHPFRSLFHVLLFARMEINTNSVILISAV